MLSSLSSWSTYVECWVDTSLMSQLTFAIIPRIPSVFILFATEARKIGSLTSTAADMTLSKKASRVEEKWSGREEDIRGSRAEN